MSEKSDLSKCIDMVRQILPKMMAQDLAYIKQMPGVIIKEIPEDGMSEEELIEQGFNPIDRHTKLIWIKKNEPS